MKGYKAVVGYEPKKAGSFKYFLERLEAESWAKNEVNFYEGFTGRTADFLIEQIELNECACGNLTEDRNCLNCEKIMMECYQ